MTRQLYEALNERDVTGKEISFTAGWLSAFKVRHDLKRNKLMHKKQQLITSLFKPL
ncbi:hypothetical protein L914_13294 [Phytophthora nicotianae]|uniref:HTH CENPB-type domain-containing protein n=1 Tax=Phytophthora nicotianae TaxID=4792 RepID=W2MX75_PHYNI|nr:hypothetical protein L914_13294 [Phytophthora nicotianae]